MPRQASPAASCRSCRTLGPEGTVSRVRKVAKLVWAAPCSIVGLAFAVVALLLGGSAKRASGTLEVTLAHSEAARPRLSRLLPFRAIALGHVIIAVGRQELEDLRAHELIHVQQRPAQFAERRGGEELVRQPRLPQRSKPNEPTG